MLAAIAVALLLLVGIALRASVRWLERARIPASVVGGVVGCAVAQILLGSTDRLDEPLVGLLSTFRSWAGLLISFVFAGLLLAPSGRSENRSRDVWQQGLCAWIIILGQLALGLIATGMLIRPFYDVPGPFGQFVEVTMAGGFGSANSMANILEAAPYHFAPARDLLAFGATAGLVWGVVSGLFLARLGSRRGWTTNDHQETDLPAGPASTMAAPTGAVEPILLQLCFLTVAFGLGFFMKFVIAYAGIRLDAWLDPDQRRYSENLGNLPLFFFTLLGGWFLRSALGQLRLAHHLDRDMIHRLCGIAMDVLIVTSLAGIAFDRIRAYIVPVLLLLAVGSVWSAFCLVWLSRRILPRRYWFELGLINYGFSTAATAQGMMFLRLVDPKLTSGAAETYALGAPLTAPFIGGGVITFVALPPLIGWLGLLPVGGIAAAMVVALYVVARQVRG